MTLNAGLMVLSALAMMPPIYVMLAKHGVSALLLSQSARLARKSPRPSTSPTKEANNGIA